MAMRVLIVVLVVACLTSSMVDAGKKDKKDRRKKVKLEDSHESHTGDEVSSMHKSIDDLWEAIGEMQSGDGGGSCGNKVHFFFHGGDDGHDHGESSDTRVHVDLHVDAHGHGDTHGHPDEAPDHEHSAHCEMQMLPSGGSIHIVQKANEDHAQFTFNFDKLGAPDTNFHIHVHEFGDLSGSDCSNLGGHFNPYNDSMPAGDITETTTDSDGSLVDVEVADSRLTLFGKNSILGRGIMIHKDDGDALACCVIGLSADNAEHAEHAHHH